MKRREFITLLGSTAATWPLHARAQQPAMPVIGVLGAVAPEPWAANTDRDVSRAQRSGLCRGPEPADRAALGARPARSASGAAGRLDRPPGLGARHGRRHRCGDCRPRTPARPFRSCSLGTDPVEDGLVASLNRPGGTITGVTFFSNLLIAKRLEMLREIVPKAALFAALVNPNNARVALDTRDIQAAAASIGQPVQILRAGTPDELDASFASMVRAGAGALLVAADGYLTSRRQQLVVLAARHALPASYATARIRRRRRPDQLWIESARTRFVKPAFTSGASSRAKSRPTSRCCCRPSSISSSTCGPPRRLASTFRRRCSRLPTM